MFYYWKDYSDHQLNVENGSSAKEKVTGWLLLEDVLFGKYATLSIYAC